MTTNLESLPDPKLLQVLRLTVGDPSLIMLNTSCKAEHINRVRFFAGLAAGYMESQGAIIVDSYRCLSDYFVELAYRLPGMDTPVLIEISSYQEGIYGTKSDVISIVFGLMYNCKKYAGKYVGANIEEVVNGFNELKLELEASHNGD